MSTKMGVSSNSFQICSVCEKSFSTRFNLNKHIRIYHPAVAAEKFSKNKYGEKYNFFCKYCKSKFTYKHHLNFHVKKQHAEFYVENRPPGTKKCPICYNYQDPYKKNIMAHLKSEHDIEITSEVFEFNTMDDFKEWKEKTEVEAKCKFIKDHGLMKSKSHAISNYTCHRSGIFVSKGKGARHMKNLGSHKIGGFCPAGLKVIENEGKLKVEYISRHVGHDTDLVHLPLPERVRQELAAKIASQMSFEAILEEVRNSYDQYAAERKRLITKKDLYNIKQCFNLTCPKSPRKKKAGKKQATPATTTPPSAPEPAEGEVVWLQETKNTDCVIFYKAQESLNPLYPQLKQDDFLLIIMNDAQREMLKKFGSGSLYIDSTRGTNFYGFELTTLMVLDDMRQGFPCAFCISNRSDHEIIYIFFSIIKVHVGEVCATEFLSETPEIFYNAWISVMPPVQFGGCRENLFRIKNHEKQVQIYKILRTILEETDQQAFNIKINKFITAVSKDPENFAKYFKEECSEDFPSENKDGLCIKQSNDYDYGADDFHVESDDNFAPSAEILPLEFPKVEHEIPPLAKRPDPETPPPQPVVELPPLPRLIKKPNTKCCSLAKKKAELKRVFLRVIDNAETIKELEALEKVLEGVTPPVDVNKENAAKPEKRKAVANPKTSMLRKLLCARLAKPKERKCADKGENKITETIDKVINSVANNAEQ